MQKILFGLYYGNINPYEGILPKEEEYRKAADQVVAMESELMSRLDDAGQELYRQLTFALITRDNIEDAYTYAIGFRTNAHIILACITQE